MPSTVRDPRRSQEILLGDSVRPAMLKASLPVPAGPAPVSLGPAAFCAVIDSVIRQVGKVEGAATDMRIDRAQLRRQLANGHLTIERLGALGADFFAQLGKELIEQFGPLATPHARALQRLNDIEDAVREVRQAVEAMST